jgi:hypothetical protein
MRGLLITIGDHPGAWSRIHPRVAQVARGPSASLVTVLMTPFLGEKDLGKEQGFNPGTG